MELAGAGGYDGGDLLAQAKTDAVQAIFDANATEAIEKGVFGSPTFIVDGELIWGKTGSNMSRRRCKASLFTHPIHKLHHQSEGPCLGTTRSKNRSSF